MKASGRRQNGAVAWPAVQAAAPTLALIITTSCALPASAGEAIAADLHEIRVEPAHRIDGDRLLVPLSGLDRQGLATTPSAGAALISGLHRIEAARGLVLSDPGLTPPATIMVSVAGGPTASSHLVTRPRGRSGAEPRYWPWPGTAAALLLLLLLAVSIALLVGRRRRRSP